jgi:hypothetical protein
MTTSIIEVENGPVHLNYRAYMRCIGLAIFDSSAG